MTPRPAACAARRAALLALLLPALPPAPAQSLPELARGFAEPPAAARPWVYWFWLNGNLTREGITADLEAMARVGIGGVLIMEVDQGAPVGPADFAGPQWRELFRHAVAEAGRLGLQINMNDDAGWNGSGGPWIKPEESMQTIVVAETEVEGPRRFEGPLPQPKAQAGFYRDIAVLAFPTPGPFRIPDIRVKAGYDLGRAGPAGAEPPAGNAIDRARVVDVSAGKDAGGHFAWDVPAGKWTIVRFGHTSTGVENAPAPRSGRGLECDKLSPKGIEAAFAGLMQKLVDDNAAAVGRTLVTTHIDSWENGAQNWTAAMREEFQERRGYDLLPFLPVVTGRVVGSLAESERFLWDLRATISELIVANYAGRMRELAHARGLQLSIEGYTAPCDELPYAGQADEPMGEFWTGGGAFETLKEMASAAHVYGKPIVGAEAFTSTDWERWQAHPGSIKGLGDLAFAAGINRFVFHRYAMQPWLDRRPGMTMGPWGLHYERTNTWWDWTGDWHRYLARCQYLLRQGRFVADLCVLQPEDAPQGLTGPLRRAYEHDQCPADAVLTRMTVRDHRLVLPDGMEYRLLVLPESPTMTPRLLARIRDLVRAGATVVGPRPVRSPSLAGQPQADAEVRQLGAELWGDGNPTGEHRIGEGRVVSGVAPETVLQRDGVPPDFQGPPSFRCLHRRGTDFDLWFVCNPQPTAVQALCTFRVRDREAALWWPESGRREAPASCAAVADGTQVLLSLGANESVFVVFAAGKQAPGEAVTALAADGKVLWATDAPVPRPKVLAARYGPPGDQARTRDVQAKAQHLVDQGETTFRVARMAEGDDPAFGVVKTLVLDCELDGRRYQVRGTDPEEVSLLPPSASSRLAHLARGADGALQLVAPANGAYELRFAGGAHRAVTVDGLPADHALAGPWQVELEKDVRLPLPQLRSLAELPDDRARHFAGVATYTATFDLPASFLAENRRVDLDLGRVEVMAELSVNGRRLGVLWRAPYRTDVTAALRAGVNTVQVRVVTQWINRMIGDELLPEDSERNADGTLKAWPQWLQDGKPSPTGRVTFTSWRLWKKEHALVPSGLIGPVVLQANAVVAVGK